MLKENNLFRSKAAFSKPFSSHSQCIHFSPLICGAFFQFPISRLTLISEKKRMNFSSVAALILNLYLTIAPFIFIYFHF